MKSGSLFSALLVSLIVAVPVSIRGDDPSLRPWDGPPRRDDAGKGMWNEAPDAGDDPLLSATARETFEAVEP